MGEFKKPLVIIGGATGVGKSDLSVKLAQRINGQIISADSMQVYKNFDIGTAKITKDEMCGVKHYMIDELDSSRDFNIFVFSGLCKKYIEKIYSEGSVPVIVGGTGFYIRSVIYETEFAKENTDTSYREELEVIARNEGGEVLYERLKAVDPDAAAKIHPNNVRRVIRALEFNHDTGGLISAHNEEQRRKESPYNFVYFVLNRDRCEIYKRIDARVDAMMEAGLEDEVRSLLESGVSKDCIPMNGLGYKEMKDYICGDTSYDEAVNMIKQNTRHYAKRQLTWFKSEKDAVWLNYEDYSGDEAMLEKMTDILKEKKIV